MASSSPHSRPSSVRSHSRPFTGSGPSSRARRGEALVDTVPELTSMSGDTVRIPGPLEVPVVRPALAMLYRLAVGPNADHYAPRFLAFERAGKPLAMWNWAAFFAPPIWAAYRGLWIAALVFALMPLAGVIAFIYVGASVDRAPGLWGIVAVLLVWVIPGTIAASFADYLVYRRVRRESLAAERESENPVDAASRVAAWHSVSWYGGAAGVAGMAVIAGAVSHDLMGAWREHVVRSEVVTTLAAVRGLEREVESIWRSARLVPRQTSALGMTAANRVVEDVNVSPDNGRLRVRFGRTVPELQGKVILLAPTRTPQQQVRWLCVPVDIPAAYLPSECRRR